MQNFSLTLSIYSFSVVFNQVSQETIPISKMDQSEFLTRGFCQKLEGRIFCFVFFCLLTGLWEISSCSNKKSRPPRKWLPVVAANKPRTLEAESGVFTSFSGTSCFFGECWDVFFPVQPLMVNTWRDGNNQRLDFTRFLPSVCIYLHLSFCPRHYYRHYYLFIDRLIDLTGTVQSNVVTSLQL